MNKVLDVIVLAVVLVATSTATRAGSRGILIEARALAYDANYRNDQSGLRAAIDALTPLADGSSVENAWAHYYLSWAYWSLAGSQIQARDNAAALVSGRHALQHARAASAIRGPDSEIQTMLANALVAVAILDRSELETLLPQIVAARQQALDLGPANPRAALFDAGFVFNTPGGDRARAVARVAEALALFDAEANAAAADPIAPRWGHALAYGAMATMCLGLTPARKDQAREAAAAALGMRPDFWYVREQILPQLR
jgi:hypothetical protein